MDQRPGVDLQAEGPEGGLRELVLRWFTETQAPLTLADGSFPRWFRGFAARRDAEDQLRDKTLGCFLIRLSDKAVGYILSYKGQDRCRHFVINQNPSGLFMVSGDSQTHLSLPNLIEHYKACPIQPFNEYLTSCCGEPSTGELYDVVKCEAKENPGVSVLALRNLYDQQRDQQSHVPTTDGPPALPPKSNNRKLTGTSSFGRKSLPQQVVPPVPRRGLPLSHSLSETFRDKSAPHGGHTQYTHTHAQTHTPPTHTHAYAEQLNVERPPPCAGSLSRAAVDQRRRGEDPWTLNDVVPNNHPRGGVSCLAPPSGGVMYSELALGGDSRSRSLPRLDDSAENEYSNRLSGPSHSHTPAASSHSRSPNPPKRVTCHTYSLQDPRDNPPRRPSSSSLGLPGNRPDGLRSNPLYQSSAGLCEDQDGPWRPLRSQDLRAQGDPGWSSTNPVPQQEDSMYAEVPQTPPPGQHFADNTYEQIPGYGGLKDPQGTAATQGNTYEMLEELKHKPADSTWGRKNIKWRRFFPEHKKK